MRPIAHLLLLLSALLSGCATQPADLVLTNGNIITVDDRYGTVEALAVRGDRVVAVGSAAEITAHIGPDTEVMDLQGKTAIPGFIEGHAHFDSLGRSKQILDLNGVRSWDEIIGMVEQAVQDAEPGEWIYGRGWHQEKWAQVPQDNVEGFPTHDSLSAISPDNPVSLGHASGHAAFFNQKAMSMAGIDRETADPHGGEIIRRPGSGEPIGVFRERAQQLVSSISESEDLRRSPAEKKAMLRERLRLADLECLANGVTSFQDAGSNFATIDTIREMVDDGGLSTRLWMMIRTGNDALARNLADYRMVGYGDHQLTVRAIKKSIDGALGPRGAWLLEPYTDSPESTGLNLATLEEVQEAAELAAQHGYQLCVHAIGDRANRETLDIFERTMAAHTDLEDLRWRVEHAQHLSVEDIPRFAELGVIASMQGIHCTSDAPYVVPRLGEQRARDGAYVWKTLLDSGAIVTNGTDAPVEDIDPIASFYATVSRRMADGERFYPQQRLSRMEALQTYTIHAAYAAHEEDVKGSLSPGKLADIVVLSLDITAVPEDQILDAEVLSTLVGGKLVYQRDPR